MSIEEIIENEEVLPEEISPAEPEKVTYMVQLDESGYYTGNYADFSTMPGSVEVEALPEETDKLKLLCYKLSDGVWIFDEERYSVLLAEQTAAKERVTALAEIKALEAEIKAINDKLTECATYRTLEQTEPYVVEELIAEKTVKQQKISALEESL